jgi:hypothetical protein
MTTTNTSSRHVQQVAELIRRLNRDEIRQLIRLVPPLLEEREKTIGRRDGLAQWAREQMAPYANQARPMQPQDAFLSDMTVEAYFALAEAERERIWDELYVAAIESAQEREVKPDAIAPAR